MIKEIIILFCRARKGSSNSEQALRSTCAAVRTTLTNYGIVKTWPGVIIFIAMGLSRQRHREHRRRGRREDHLGGYWPSHGFMSATPRPAKSFMLRVRLCSNAVAAIMPSGTPEGAPRSLPLAIENA